MKWTIISADLRIRLQAGEPEYESLSKLSLKQVVEVVSSWTRSHDDEQAEAWLEAANEKVTQDQRAKDEEELISLL